LCGSSCSRLRLELLKAEKELTRASDALARRRQELSWVRVDKVRSWRTRASALWPSVDPRVPVSHRIILRCLLHERGPLFSRFQFRQISRAVMSGAEGPADARRTAPQGRR
jgi:hypothetical protein